MASLANLCSDIDQCQDGNGGCDHMCKDAIGLFNCSCYEGYSLDVDGNSCIGMQPQIEEHREIGNLNFWRYNQK